MALPTTNITTTHVRNAIGESTNKLSELVLSPKVNEFGFNVPESIQLNTFWGKTVAERTDTALGYPLGLFRAYDHDWVAWSMGGVMRTSPANYHDTMVMRASVIPAAPFLEDKPDVSIDHVFSVEFSRTNNFHQNGGSLILDHVTKSISLAQGYLDFSFDNQNPPDGGAALGENDTFYINIIHHSSPDRRWYITGESLATSSQGEDNYVTSHQVPEDPFTYYVGYQTSAVSFQDNSIPDELHRITVNIMSDTPTGGYVNIAIQAADNPDFINYVSANQSSVYYTANSTPGTSQKNGSVAFDVTGGLQHRLSAGDTLYWKVSLDGIWGGIHQTTVGNSALF